MTDDRLNDPAKAQRSEPPYYRVAILGCGAEKQDEAAPAFEMYTSTYFEKKREYAEATCEYGYVLSAKHGLIPAHKEIDPYDARVSDLTEAGREHLQFRVAQQLHSKLNLGAHELVLLMGESYRELLKPVLRRAARSYYSEQGHDRVYSPFEEENLGGIGKQMEWLDSQKPKARVRASADEDGQTSLAALADGGGG
jgi:hypothetical protein